MATQSCCLFPDVISNSSDFVNYINSICFDCGGKLDIQITGRHPNRHIKMEVSVSESNPTCSKILLISSLHDRLFLALCCGTCMCGIAKCLHLGRPIKFNAGVNKSNTDFSKQSQKKVEHCAVTCILLYSQINILSAAIVSSPLFAWHFLRDCILLTYDLHFLG